MPLQHECNSRVLDGIKRITYTLAIIFTRLDLESDIFHR